MSQELMEGMTAPGFSLESDLGGEVTLEALRGRPVVLYFYPKDDTPGCTKEACAFRDVRLELAKHGAIVLGVSKDDLASHGKFRAKYGLEFALLSDPTGRVCEAYGAWKEKSNYGRTSMGIERSTFLIDRQGVVRKAWRKVKVEGHDAEVLEALKGV